LQKLINGMANTRYIGRRELVGRPWVVLYEIGGLGNLEVEEGGGWRQEQKETTRIK
jgi:hypothetical protein